MNRRIWNGTAILLGVAIALAAPALADDDAWVTDDEQEILISHVGVATVDLDEAEQFDLSELRDGETREFGSGERQITATRNGDEVTLTCTDTGDDAPMTIRCTVGVDTCKILTIDGEPDKLMIMVHKTRTCDDGEGDCAQIMTELGMPEGAARVIVRKTIECDDSGDCTETDHTMHHGEAEAHAVVEIMTRGKGLHDLGEMKILDGDGSGRVMMVTAGTGLTLRCPEGDTTMHLDADTDEVFLCPKHSLPLEKAAVKHGPRRIMIRSKPDKE